MAVKLDKAKSLIGAWAFLIGVLLALVFGFLAGETGIDSNVSLILVVIGLVVGLLNVTERESNRFLMSGAVLVIASALGGNIINNPNLSNILDALLAIFVPATIVVAIRNVFSIARN